MAAARNVAQGPSQAVMRHVTTHIRPARCSWPKWVPPQARGFFHAKALWLLSEKRLLAVKTRTVRGPPPRCRCTCPQGDKAGRCGMESHCLTTLISVKNPSSEKMSRHSSDIINRVSTRPVQLFCRSCGGLVEMWHPQGGCPHHLMVHQETQHWSVVSVSTFDFPEEFSTSCTPLVQRVVVPKRSGRPNLGQNLPQFRPDLLPLILILSWP